MCICINCRHIHTCLTYKFIKKQHYKESKDITNNITFTPVNTVVDVGLNKKENLIYIDWDLIECLSFIEKPGYWLKPKGHHL
uniref:Ycf34 n=1 Tax=Chondria sp. (in: red algae) TaxID=1982705 RepID=A0A1Z1MC71_9FLOR|nr:hypothetical protein [Chondria sp. (in: red algae)]